MNCLSFPLSATGDLSNRSICDSAYRMGVDHYFMKNIYLRSPFLYAVIGTLFWGMMSGLLGVFTAAMSSLIRVKYNIFLILPVFMVLNLSAMLATIFPEEMPSIKWYDYVLLFNDELKSMGLLAMSIVVLVLFPVGAVRANGRKDCL